MRITWLVLLLTACATRPFEDPGAPDLARPTQDGSSSALDLALAAPDLSVAPDSGAAFCGGFSDVQCPSGSYCELEGCRVHDGGSCQPKPTACTDNVDPVCGCDGITYGNDCERRAAGVALDHPGSCGADCQAAACDQVGGYCACGDVVEPTCNPGYTKQGACGPFGICCVLKGG